MKSKNDAPLTLHAILTSAMTQCREQLIKPTGWRFGRRAAQSIINYYQPELPILTLFGFPLKVDDALGADIGVLYGENLECTFKVPVVDPSPPLPKYPPGFTMVTK